MEKKAPKDSSVVPERPEYDPPKVEHVIGSDEIAREVHYAGGAIPLSDVPR